MSKGIHDLKIEFVYIFCTVFKLGWGASCDDEAHLPHLLDKYERATTKMLDRYVDLFYLHVLQDYDLANF